MTIDKELEEPFLSRWSRLKAEAATAKPPPPPAAGPAPAELPPVEQLTLESDFKAFLHPKVEEHLKRAALKKLFSDPRFNRMDGLDVYIDDYNLADPLPEGMLEKLSQYQTLLDQRRASEQERGDQGKALATGEAEAALPEPAAASPAEQAAGAGLEQPGTEAAPAKQS
jgi:hypothetical protein